ncbi:MAG: DUF1573 domain-containing protein [Bacteroidetes bacterium]|nr:DUF1573 domain-containing protein [Bacteroidota bacterium]
MLKQFKIGFLAVLTVAMLASCKNDGADRDAATDAAAGTPVSTTDGGGIGTTATQQMPGQATPVTPDAAAQTAAPTGPTTTMSFTETEFNFGKVKAGEKVQHEYSFKNTGKEPLVISNAKGSCGCTVPVWPKEPIAPGSTAKIKVEFDSKGKSGPQTKQVTITANTDPPQSIIYIKGDVIADPNAPAPTAAPNLQVKQ